MGRRAWYTLGTIAEWIRLFMADNGYAPTGADMAQAFGISKSGARSYFMRLENAGYIQRGKGLRNLTVNDERIAA